jgi:hypothetical protein
MSITLKHLAALIGFAFVAVWIATGFGHAVLCLLGALAFYGLAALIQGDLRLAALQDRLGSRKT